MNTNKYDAVCCHGRPIACLECAADYLEEIKPKESAPPVSSPLQAQWQDISTAPKGGFPEGYTGPNDTRNPAWVEPPRILALVDGQPMIVYWDNYYAEGGSGYTIHAEPRG